MTRIWDRLFIGEIADTREVAESNAFRVGTVISLCREPVRIRRGGVNYLSFPVVETHPMPTGWLDPIIDALFENVRWGRVLVACSEGTSWAPIVAAAWMHVVGCKDIDAALADIAMLRPIEPSAVVLASARRALC